MVKCICMQGLLRCLFHECVIDMLLGSEAAHGTAVDELRKKIDEIVKELNTLKEVHALLLGTE